MTTDDVARDIPEEMAEKDEDRIALRLARGRQWLAQEAGQRMGMPIPAWDDLTPDEQKDAEWEARAWLRAAYNTEVAIVPAGRTVVELPENWRAELQDLEQDAYDQNVLDGRRATTEQRCAYAAGVEAAMERIEFWRAGSGVGDQDGD